jgi:Permuted papain-like amidase enzyme, YaeF/YiiX, C92 family
VGFRRWITDRLVEFLTEPLPRYAQRGWNDPEALRRHARKGDVLLVAGDNRISAIIRYLTQSSWSHAALYVGDELMRRGGPRADEARRRYGEEADQLMVEALPEGVVASPLSKYVDFNIRLVRPHGLRREDRDRILNEAMATLGWRYDLRNVLDLARYLLPVRLVPARFQRSALHFGSGTPTEVICSSLIGQLFQRVRFPILPPSDLQGGSDGPAPPVRGRLLRRILGHPSRAYTGLFQMRHPTQLTPADFDLSPYFEIVKFNVIADGAFDYRRIRWASEPAAAPAAAAPALRPGAAKADRPAGA